MMNNRILDVIVFLGIATNAQPPPAPATFRGAAGQEASDDCTMPRGKCAADGADNWVSRDLTYDKSTGKFVGSMTSNRCPWKENGGLAFQITAIDAECIMQPFPAPGSDTAAGPLAAPLRGPLAYSMHGLDIYGPFEGAFANGQASCDAGYCPEGLDVPACEEMLTYFCGDDVQTAMFGDSCGGHSKPYHHHGDMPCDYDEEASGHSDIVAIGLDGVAVYGKFEEGDQLPTDLDACGGHFGPTPGSDEYGIEASEHVYHYHLQGEAPYTLGCFGPVQTQQECMDLYPECSDGNMEIVFGEGDLYDDNGERCYNVDCPCYDDEGKNTDRSVAGCFEEDVVEVVEEVKITPAPTPDPTAAPTPDPTSRSNRGNRNRGRRLLERLMQ